MSSGFARKRISEESEAHTPPERRRIDRRKLVGLFMGPILMIAVIMLPTALTAPQQNLLAVILVTVTYWVFQPLPIPVTSLLGLALAVVLDVASASQVFGAFSSPTLFLLIGGFIITRSMSKYGLGHRIALKVLSIPGIGNSTVRIVVAFGAMAALLSGFIDNGAVAAMLLPIALGLVKTFSDDIERGGAPSAEGKPLYLSSALLLMTAYGATLGALMTPFGDASNMVGRHFIETRFDTHISVMEWMALGVPIVLALFALLCVAVLFINPPELRRIPNAKAQILRSRRKLGRMSQGEINTAIAFGAAITLWLLPPILSVVVGSESPVYIFVEKRLSPPVVALLGAILLFLLPISRKEGFTLRWQDTAAMDWGPLILVGSALALGTLMAETGLAQVLGEAVAERIQGVGPIWVCVFAAVIAISMSELTSNLVSISVLVPIIPTLAVAGGGDPQEAALVATFAAIYGFMLPISTSANAIVYSSGEIPFKRMIKTGLLVDLSGVVVVVTGVLVIVRFFGVL
ncbi:DASS family sodium-coupled anion symporter [Marinobacter nanhaiticus D15-8W]|uniref:SLC13 family permease n=1 Tax=Marinobacter nanhaiticus D15-8W TaxID=626887 RepID=N6W8D8_9GAMM|nr:SLC13 family permease [Marinobacter nanhaiticus]ENO16539.1 SLC13 family permease [Marinobacter nanhaiticus D15-8W]BES72330.1 DASS family sodium-coupled anion symporter [Marinobacter nanhaiticus D15-8W]